MRPLWTQRLTVVWNTFNSSSSLAFILISSSCWKQHHSPINITYPCKQTVNTEINQYCWGSMWPPEDSRCVSDSRTEVWCSRPSGTLSPAPACWCPPAAPPAAATGTLTPPPGQVDWLCHTCVLPGPAAPQCGHRSNSSIVCLNLWVDALSKPQIPQKGWKAALIILETSRFNTLTGW